MSIISLLWFTRLLESVRSLSRLTSSCCAGTEKEKLAGTADTGAAGVGGGGGTAVVAGVGADEDVTPGVVSCAAGVGDGEGAAEGEGLEESADPGSVAEAAAESLFLCWKLAALSLSRWVFLGDFFLGVEVFLGCGFRRHLGMSCRSLG